MATGIYHMSEPVRNGVAEGLQSVAAFCQQLMILSSNGPSDRSAPKLKNDGVQRCTRACATAATSHIKHWGGSGSTHASRKRTRLPCLGTASCSERD